MIKFNKSPIAVAASLSVISLSAILFSGALRAIEDIYLSFDPDESASQSAGLEDTLDLSTEQKSLVLVVTDDNFSRLIHLPKSAPRGATVTVIKASQLESRWRTFAVSKGKRIFIPANKETILVWNGKMWTRAMVRMDNLTTLNFMGFFEVSLKNTKPASIASVPVSVVPGAVQLLDVPLISDPGNIKIVRNRIVNNTSHVLHDVYLKHENGTFYYLQFSVPIPEYASAWLPAEWRGAHVIDMTKLGSNKFTFQSFFKDRNEDGRWANFHSRKNIERVLRYEHYWTNAPETLPSIIKHVEKRCGAGTDVEGFAECRDSRKPMLEYIANMYFAQSFSGLTSDFIIDAKKWRHAEAEVGSKNLVSSNEDQSAKIWMSAELVEYMDSNYEPRVSIEVDQALVHEHFHNLGFDHESGWPSTDGIDDLFAAEAYKYRQQLGSRYVPSNLVVDVQKISPLIYTISLHGRGEITDLKMRLLSTKNVNAEVTELGSNKLTIKFKKVPYNDIYLSFFSQESQQMASVTLTDFKASVFGRQEVENLPNNFSKLVNNYGRVFIHTSETAWLSDFELPMIAPEGHTVVFVSRANIVSYIHHTSSIRHGGRPDILEPDHRVEYRFTNGKWELMGNYRAAVVFN